MSRSSRRDEESFTFVTRGPLFDNQSMAVRGDGEMIFHKLKSSVLSSSQFETRHLFANMNSEGD